MDTLPGFTIGGASAGIGDGAIAVPQLVRSGKVDCLMLDFLSEVYMPIAGRARLADPTAGFVPYFAHELIAPVARELADRAITVVTNAGAVNPHGCAAAVRQALEAEGVALKVAVVDGDDLLARAGELRERGLLRAALPEGASYTTINAYLGAFPIARALELGADIVITGRVVDSALALGPLIHAFGWQEDDYDLLAAGSLIGHMLECGAQASGGVYTDWEEAGGDYSNIGYPIAECAADGSAVFTRPEGTGGTVTVGTLSEQLLYEIGDPAAYRLPDVIADFSQVRIAQAGPDRVLVSGARGRPPGPDLKVNATWDDGVIAALGLFMRGQDAARKARVTAQSVLDRISQMLRARQLPPLRRTRIETFGDESSYGALARPGASREVFCRIAIEAADTQAIPLLLREGNLGSVSMAPGVAGSSMIVNPMPVARLEQFMIPAAEVPARVTIGETSETVARSMTHAPCEAPRPVDPPAPALPADCVVALRELAWVRSGDKADDCNIGVSARRPEYLPYIAAALDDEALGVHFASMLGPDSAIERYYLPGSHSLNIVLKHALDGGCTQSLRFDPFGKSAAQDALDMPVAIAGAVMPEVS